MCFVFNLNVHKIDGIFVVAFNRFCVVLFFSWLQLVFTWGKAILLLRKLKVGQAKARKARFPWKWHETPMNAKESETKTKVNFCGEGNERCSKLKELDIHRKEYPCLDTGRGRGIFLAVYAALLANALWCGFASIFPVSVQNRQFQTRTFPFTIIRDLITHPFLSSFCLLKSVGVVWILLNWNPTKSRMTTSRALIEQWSKAPRR